MSVTDRRTDIQMDICDSIVAFATENGPEGDKIIVWDALKNGPEGDINPYKSEGGNKFQQPSQWTVHQYC